MKVVVTDAAVESLESIIDFVGYTAGQAKALLIGKTLIAEALNLNNFPYKGAIEPLLEDQTIEFRRVIIEDRYKIVYHIGSEAIYVFRFFDTRQNPSKMKG